MAFKHVCNRLPPLDPFWKNAWALLQKKSESQAAQAPAWFRALQERACRAHRCAGPRQKHCRTALSETSQIPRLASGIPICRRSAVVAASGPLTAPPASVLSDAALSVFAGRHACDKTPQKQPVPMRRDRVTGLVDCRTSCLLRSTTWIRIISRSPGPSAAPLRPASKAAWGSSKTSSAVCTCQTRDLHVAEVFHNSSRNWTNICDSGRSNCSLSRRLGLSGLLSRPLGLGGLGGGLPWPATSVASAAHPPRKTQRPFRSSLRAV